jgi:hypothetical protein
MITKWPYQVISVPTSEQLDHMRARELGFSFPVAGDPTVPTMIPTVTLALAATIEWMLSMGWKQGDPVPSVYRIQTVLHERDMAAYPIGSVHWIDYPAGNGMPRQPERGTSTPSDA